MSEPAYFKVSCGACDGHISYPETSAGTTVACPHCGKNVFLPYQATAPEILEPTVVDADYPQNLQGAITPPTIRPAIQNPSTIPQRNNSEWGSPMVSTLMALGMICYAFGLVDFVGMFFHYDITGVSWSPIVAGFVGSIFISTANTKKKSSAVQGYNSSGKSMEGVIWGVGIVLALAVVASIVYLASGHKLTTKDLEAQVRQSIQDKFSKDHDTSGIQIKSFSLVHESGSKYKGVLEIQSEQQNLTEDVEVTYDGNGFIWKTVPLSVSHDSSPARTVQQRQIPIAQDTPQPEAQPQAQSVQTLPNYDWNTTEIDAVKNGNIAVAVNWVNRNSALRGAAIAPQPQYIAKQPWNYYGKVVRVTGTVGVVQDYPAGSDNAINGNDTADIVILCGDGTIAEIFCMKPSGNITTGCTVTLYGYPVGVTEVPNRVGGTDTHLIMVGNDYENFGVRN